MSEREDDFDRGLRNRRAALGDAWVEQSTGKATAFNADFQSLVTRYAWHEIWGRPGLDFTTRRLLVLGMTMGQARWEEFELHCRAAVRGGVPLEKIQETLLQGAIYCGVPAANTAFKITMQILRDEGLMPEPAPLVPGVRVQRQRTLSLPQLMVALQGADEGLPVVMAHGLGLDHRMWEGLAATLAPQHPVLRYDARGHGGSTVPAGPYSMAQMVDDAARVVREWGRGPVVFVGLSMGGMVAQGLAVRHPDLVRGLVLANTASRYPAGAAAGWAERIAAVQAGGMTAVTETLLGRFFAPAFAAASPEVVESQRRTLLRCDPAGYVAGCHAVAAVAWHDALPALRCPTLVIAGSADPSTPPALGQSIADAVLGARYVELQGAAHLSVLEQPSAFADAVTAFLAALR